MKIGVIGSGYVGLVTAVSLARRGHEVVAIDTDPARVSTIRAGKQPFFEPGLEGLLRDSVREGRLATTEEIAMVLDCDVALVTVATPGTSDGRVDTRQLREAARALGSAWLARQHAPALQTIFVKSTVLPGTTRLFESWLRDSIGVAADRVRIGFVPEFLREGNAVQEALQPDRIVVGADDPAVFETAAKIYCDSADPAPYCTSVETAELIKYANNAFLALCISFSNEIARIAESLPGVDAEEALEGVRLDRRWHVGSQRPSLVEYLKAGCGFGGSCFDKDVRALTWFTRDRKIPSHVLPAILDVNETQPTRLVDLIEGTTGTLEGKSVLVLGLAFKPNTDDVRESPAFKIVDALERRGAIVSVHDPEATAKFLSARSGAAREAVDWREVARNADVIALVTSWELYLRELPQLLTERTTPVVLADGRGVFRRASWSPLVRYCVVGRGEEGAHVARKGTAASPRN